ncbi:MAG: hypothetical protein ABID79_04610 [Elusimicrobiota bacterium]
MRSMFFLMFFCLLCVGVGHAQSLDTKSNEIVDGKLIFGIEAGTIFNQELEVKENPTMTVAETLYDTVESITTTKNYDYFYHNQTDVWGDSITTTNSWEDIQNKANLLLLKCGYAITEKIEAAIKLGVGDKRIYYTEKTITKYRSTSLLDNYDENTVSTTKINNFPQDFGYGLEIKGDLYRTDNFQVRLGAQVYQQKNKTDLSDCYSVEKSTMGVVNEILLDRYSLDTEEFIYQISLNCDCDLGYDYIKPYFGFAIVDGNIKFKREEYFDEKYYTDGVFTDGVKEETTVEAELKPKNNFTLILGLNFPFDESGGINVECKLLGETAISIGSNVKF